MARTRQLLHTGLIFVCLFMAIGSSLHAQINNIITTDATIPDGQSFPDCNGKIKLDIGADACSTEQCQVLLYFAENCEIPDCPTWESPFLDGESVVIDGLCPGTYQLEVYNPTYDCTFRHDGDIEICASGTNPTVTAELTHPCNGEDSGAISLSVDGFNDDFSFEWDNGSTSSSLTGLTAGTYKVTVTDACGGSTTERFKLEKCEIEFDFDADLSECKFSFTVDDDNLPDGVIVEWIWSFGDETILSVAGDITTVTHQFMNANPPIIVSLVGKLENGELTERFEEELPVCCDASDLSATATSQASSGMDGSIMLNVTGGEAPYVFEWSKRRDDSFSSMEQSPTGLGVGLYSVTVTDNSGCTFELVLEVEDCITKDFDASIIAPFIICDKEKNLNCRVLISVNGMNTEWELDSEYQIEWLDNLGNVISTNNSNNFNWNDIENNANSNKSEIKLVVSNECYTKEFTQDILTTDASNTELQDFFVIEESPCSGDDSSITIQVGSPVIKPYEAIIFLNDEQIYSCTRDVSENEVCAGTLEIPLDGSEDNTIEFIFDNGYSIGTNACIISFDYIPPADVTVTGDTRFENGLCKTEHICNGKVTTTDSEPEIRFQDINSENSGIFSCGEIPILCNGEVVDTKRTSSKRMYGIELINMYNTAVATGMYTGPPPSWTDIDGNANIDVSGESCFPEICLCWSYKVCPSTFETTPLGWTIGEFPLFSNANGIVRGYTEDGCPRILCASAAIIIPPPETFDFCGEVEPAEIFDWLNINIGDPRDGEDPDEDPDEEPPICCEDTEPFNWYILSSRYNSYKESYRLLDGFIGSELEFLLENYAADHPVCADIKYCTQDFTVCGGLAENIFNLTTDLGTCGYAYSPANANDFPGVASPNSCVIYDVLFHSNLDAVYGANTTSDLERQLAEAKNHDDYPSEGLKRFLELYIGNNKLCSYISHIGIACPDENRTSVNLKWVRICGDVVVSPLPDCDKLKITTIGQDEEFISISQASQVKFDGSAESYHISDRDIFFPPAYITEGREINDIVTSNDDHIWTTGSFFLEDYDVSFIENVKKNSSGSIEWAMHLQSDNSSTKGNSIAINESDNSAVIVGQFGGQLIYPSSYTMNSQGETDIVVSKFTEQGGEVWSKQVGGIGKDAALSVGTTSNDATYVTGYIEGPVEFDNLAPPTPPGQQSMFVTKYDANGQAEWVHSGSSLGGEDFENSTLTVDSEDNVIVAGEYEGNFNLQGNASVLSSSSGEGVFVAKYDESGSITWANRVANSSDMDLTAVVVDDEDNVMVAGHFSGLGRFDNGESLVSEGGTDLFFAQYNSEGELIQIQQKGGEGDDYIYDFATNGSGTYVYTGASEDENGDLICIVDTVGVCNSLMIESTVTAACGESGAIELSVDGGDEPYTYLWSNDAITSSLENIPAGEYSVTVTDANNCSTELETIVVEGDESPIQLSPRVSADFCESNSGFARVTASGGKIPYSYVWSNGETTSTNRNIPAGDYTVTVTDANGCVSVLSITVENRTVEIALNSDVNPTICDGAEGSIDVTARGGRGPYSYVWSNGETTSLIENLSEGSYSVTVTDRFGCTATQTEYIKTEELEITILAKVGDTSCDETNGAIKIGGLGGTAPYTYEWSNGETGRYITGLDVGTYTVTVTDANGCIGILSKTVTYRNLPQVTASITPITCGMLNGAIDLSVRGGKRPYAFVWSNGMTGRSIDNLEAGEYTVTVTDSRTCSVELTVNIEEQKSTIELSIGEVIASHCDNPTGGISIVQMGGRRPFTYEWSNGRTTRNLSNALPGVYSLIVTDGNDCTAEIEVEVPPISQLEIIADITPTKCGEENGNITISVSGGEIPYTYAWSNDGSTNSIANLDADNYSVTVMDSRGCTVTASYTIEESEELTITTTLIHPSSNVSMDGSIEILVETGVAPYTYAWSNGANTSTITDLSEGTYTVIITDSNGCILEQDVVLEFEDCGIISDVIHTTCGENNGSINLTRGGFTQNFSATWTDTGLNTYTRSNLEPGTYTVNIYAKRPVCNTTLVFVIEGEEAMELEASVTNPTLGQNGSIDLLVSGGVLPYTYAWSNGATTEDLENLAAGTYTVTITDANNCTLEQSFEVEVEEQVCDATLEIIVTNPSCADSNDGSLEAVVSGAGVYTYVWSDENATTNSILSGLGITSNMETEVYTVTATEAGGCIYTLSQTINIPTLLDASATITASNDNDGSIDLLVSGGLPSYSYAWSNDETTEDLENLAAGTYTVTITDANNCTLEQSFEVEGCDTEIEIQVNPLSCLGTSDAELDVIVPGNESDYIFEWSDWNMDLPEPTGILNSDISAGTYTVTITHIPSGCVYEVSRTVNEYIQLEVSVTTTPSNSNDGSIDLLVSGGVSPYTYAWSNGAITEDLSDISVGTYTVTITDTDNCTLEQSFEVEGCEVEIEIQVHPVSCYGGSDGELDITVPGSESDYTFEWSDWNMDLPEPIGILNSDLSAGTYTVTITHIPSGCVYEASQTINIPTLLEASATTTTSNSNDGSIDLLVSGGVSPYTYAWSNGAITEDLSDISVGTYTVTITDTNNCTLEQSFEVEGCEVEIEIQVHPVSCHGGSDGELDITVPGSESDYTFEWSDWNMDLPEPTSILNSDISAGTYTITITHISSGCVSVISQEVTQPEEIGIDITFYDDNSWADLDDTWGGTPPYAYEWSSGEIGQEAHNLTPGINYVTVTDANDCEASFEVLLNECLTFEVNNIISPTTFGGFDGKASANISGGNPPFNYLWSNGETTEDAIYLSAGEHYLEVSDSQGCIAYYNFIMEDIYCNVRVDVIDVESYTDTYGLLKWTATVDAHSGTPPYHYSWSNGSTGNQATELNIGEYYVTVTDVNDCIEIERVNISPVNECPDINLNIIPEYECDGSGLVQLTPEGVPEGADIYWYRHPQTAHFEQNTYTSQASHLVTLEDQPLGTYTLTAWIGEGCIYSTTITIEYPIDLQLIDIEEPLYHHELGTATVIANGGTPPYNYLWSNGETGITANNLPVGDNDVSVTDDTGCTTSIPITINPTVCNDGLSVTTIEIISPTQGSDNGQITIMVNGDRPPFSYQWSNGETTQNISDLASGVYTVTVEDNIGCTNIKYVVVPPEGELDIVDVCDWHGIITSGGEDGYFVKLPLYNYDVIFHFEFFAYRVPDRLVISTLDDVLYDTDCLGTDCDGNPMVIDNVYIEAGEQAYLTILGHCDCNGEVIPGSTIWDLNTYCDENPNAPRLNMFTSKKWEQEDLYIPKEHVNMQTEKSVKKEDISSYKVYPNPFKNRLDLEFSSNKEQLVTVKLIDIMGRCVFKTEESFHLGINSKAINLDNNKLQEGVYSILLTEASGKTHSKKIVHLQ